MDVGRMLSGYEQKLARESRQCLDLLVSSQDTIFVWSTVDKNVLCVNWRKSGHENGKTEIQVLKPSSDIYFDVECLLPNKSFSYICLWSSDGLAVMKLPQTYDINKKVCKVDFIDQQYILGKHVKVRAVKWHPGSPTDSHIVVLTDDEMLRCHSITEELLWLCPFYKSRDTASLRHTLPDWSSLGMIAIDFDFIFPVEQQISKEAVWPILVLYENGEIYLVETKMKKNKYSFQGPLIMYPSSRDNYGLDASSILVINSSPPLVVVSTCDNMLYHSILMTDKGLNKKALYVFEAINLDIAMNLLDEDDVIPSRIRLKHDPIDKSRYFCAHIGGLQLITIPFVTNLTKFWEEDSVTFHSPGEFCSIQNLVCTAIVKDSKSESAPILGFTFIDLFMTVLVLQNNGKIVHVKPFITPNCIVNEFSEGNSQTEDDFFQAIECRAKEARSMQPPLLRLPKNTSPQDCSIVVSRASKSISNVMKTHKDISLMLNHKTEMIKDSIDDQLQEITDLKAKKTELKEGAESIAIKYEELIDTQHSLVIKVDQLLRKMHAADAPLSQNQIETLKRLKNLQNTIESIEEKIGKLKSGFDYQANAGGLKENSFRNKTAFLNNVRVSTLRAALTTFTQEIASTKASLEEQSNILNQLNLI